MTDPNRVEKKKSKLRTFLDNIGSKVDSLYALTNGVGEEAKAAHIAPREYRVRDDTARSPEEIARHAREIDKYSWVHDSTSGSGTVPRITPEMEARGAAAEAAGLEVTGDILEGR